MRSPHTNPIVRSLLAGSLACVIALHADLRLGIALAQPASSAEPASGIDGLIAELARARAARADPSRLAAERDAAAQLEFDLRSRLIAAAVDADDDRLATWMLDQAGELLDRLASEGAEASAFMGLPTSRQRDRVRTDAGASLDLIGRAEQAAARTIRKLQDGLLKDRDLTPDQARAAAERVEASLRTLIDVEQAARVPYYRGRAAALFAAIEPASSATRAAREEQGRLALTSLASLKLNAPAAEAKRRLTLASALLSTFGREDKPRAQGAELLRWIVEHPLAGGELAATQQPDSVTRAAAWMGLLRAASGEKALRSLLRESNEAARSAPFVIAGKTDPLLALLLAEGVARAMIEQQPRDEAQRALWLADALAPLSALLTRDDLAQSRQSLRGPVVAKLAAACDLASATGGRPVPFDKLDPIVTYARAVSLVQAGSADAPALFQSLADREDAGDLRAEALWELAVLAWSPSTSAPGRAASDNNSATGAGAAVEHLTRLAREFPRSARAAEAAVKAVEICRYVISQRQGAQALSSKSPEAARLVSQYARALELAYTLAPQDPETTQRRLERARLALDEASMTGVMSPERLDAALGALEGVRAGTEDERRQADQLAVSAIDSALGSAKSAVGSATPAEITNARESLIAVARRALQWAQQRKPEAAPTYRLALAEALVDGNDARAAALFEEMHKAIASVPPQEARRIRLGLGRSQRLAGRPGDAFATLRALVEDIDHDPDANTRRRDAAGTYWLAWAEMLEILQADNADGKRSKSIRGQIARLRMLDADLGVKPARERIDAVARAVDAGP